MQCLLPPPLTEDQISAALDDDADPVVQQHLAQCPSCTARLAEARRFEHTLKARLYRSDCPTPQELGDYHLGLTGAAEARRVAGHLEECVRCRAEVEELREFLVTGAMPRTSPRPEPARPAWPSLGELIARVLPRAPALAARGAGGGPLIAQADGATLILDVQPADDGQVALIGQLVTDDQDRWTGALVTLRQAGAVRTTAILDDIGGFSCGPLPAGPTEVRITPRLGRPMLVPEIDLAG